MARVSGRNVGAAWVVALFCFAVVAALVIVTVPLWGDLSTLLDTWWRNIAPFQGK